MSEEHSVLDLGRLANDVWRVFSNYDSIELIANEIATGHTKGRDVLEAGCGSGKMSIALALRGAPYLRCFGVDISPDAVAYARKLAQTVEMQVEGRLAVAFSVGDFVREPLFTDGQFHFVFSEGVPEHFGRTDPLRQRYFDLCAKAASKKVVILVPNLDCPEQQAVSKATHHHYEGCTDVEEDFTKEELTDRLTAAGLEKVNVRPVTSGPWEKSRFLMGVAKRAA